MASISRQLSHIRPQGTISADRLASTSGRRAALPSLSAAATAAAASTRTIPFGTSFIDAHRAAGNLGKIDLFDRLSCLIAVGHLHKCETAGTPRFTIRDDVDRRYLAVFRKCLPEIFFGSIVRQVAHVNVSHALIPFCTWRDSIQNPGKTLVYQFSGTGQSPTRHRRRIGEFGNTGRVAAGKGARIGAGMRSACSAGDGCEMRVRRSGPYLIRRSATADFVLG